jgi:hypothetical protein
MNEDIFLTNRSWPESSLFSEDILKKGLSFKLQSLS